MKLGKGIINLSIQKLTCVFPDFDRFVDKKGIDNVIDAWDEVFEKTTFKENFSDEKLKEIFKKAIEETIATSNKFPYVSDIINKMQEIIENRKFKIIEENGVYKKIYED
jgi:hypothetical protein